MSNINALLTKLESESTHSKILLADSERRIQELSTELSALKDELASLRVSYNVSQNQVETLKDSLDKSARKLTEVSKLLNDSSESWRLAYLNQRTATRRAKVWTYIIAIASAAAGVAAGYLLGK